MTVTTGIIRPARSTPSVALERRSEGEVARASQRSLTLRGVCRKHKARLVLTYVLFNLENAADLTQPWLLGLVIGSLLEGRSGMLIPFVTFYVLRTTTGVLRRVFDTRTFARMYGELAAGIVIDQRERQVAVSRVAARATLAREVTDFLERDVPILFSSAYMVVGAVVMLGFYDVALVPVAIATGIFSLTINIVLGRRTTSLNRGLNDVLEDEVAVISTANPRAAQEHYAHLARWQTSVSDWQALAFSTTQTFVLALLVTALLRVASWNVDAVGDVYAVFRYVTMFTAGVAGVPMLVHRVARLRDIRRRFAT